MSNQLQAPYSRRLTVFSWAGNSKNQLWVPAEDPMLFMSYNVSRGGSGFQMRLFSSRTGRYRRNDGTLHAVLLILGRWRQYRGNGT